MTQEDLTTQAEQAAEAAEPQAERELLMGQLIDSANARASMYSLVSIFGARKPEGPVVGMLSSTINADNALDEGLISQGLRDIAGYLGNLDTANILDLLVDYGLAIENLPSGVTASGMELAVDYLGSACDSMCLMCQREAEMLAAGDLETALRLYNVQSGMFAERFEKWVPGFCAQVEPEVNTAFYQGALKFIRGFVAEERLYIDDSVAAIEELMAGPAAE